MQNQALFPSKDKSKTLKCRLLQFLFGYATYNTRWLKKVCKCTYKVFVPTF